MPKPCKDCVAEGITTNRPAPFQGPRCSSHNRARKKEKSAQSHEKRLEQVYGLTKEQYDTLLAAQGGKCFICQIATGATKRLAVDHDHKTGIVRSLLCGRCNFELVGRYTPEMLDRAKQVLLDPPAPKIIGHVYVPEEGT